MYIYQTTGVWLRFSLSCLSCFRFLLFRRLQIDLVSFIIIVPGLFFIVRVELVVVARLCCRVFSRRRQHGCTLQATYVYSVPKEVSNGVGEQVFVNDDTQLKAKESGRQRGS